MHAEIRPLVAADREQWERLARAYKAFYEIVLPDAAYEQTWQRLLQQDGIHGSCAQVDGRLVGITHYLYHTGIWTPKVCYLEDLFVEPATRGQGIARALIDAVAHSARAAGATRLYWLTHETNATARALYDKVAKYSGFLEYEYPL
jgi:GNAT superfamily N-acetyltransferase